MDSGVTSKVLVLDKDVDCYDAIKSFCEQNSLVGLKVSEEHVMSVLRSNVDLGGVMLSERCAGLGEGGSGLARQINQIRPELPIFLRRRREAGVDEEIGESERKLFSAIYRIDEIAGLQQAIQSSIFRLNYPNALVRGIAEMSKFVLESQFPGMQVTVETPYLVRDRIIFGEIFTLIPLESSWCRGYMMLQAEEAALRHVIPDTEGFRDMNNVLGEITNLIWGAFKNRYIREQLQREYLSQVPIIINHQHRYISFGSEDAQLCFKYVLSNADGKEVMALQQRFIFNLSWSPEDFAENQTSVEDLCESGELELF